MFDWLRRRWAQAGGPMQWDIATLEKEFFKLENAEMYAHTHHDFSQPRDAIQRSLTQAHEACVSIAQILLKKIDKANAVPSVECFLYLRGYVQPSHQPELQRLAQRLMDAGSIEACLCLLELLKPHKKRDIAERFWERHYRDGMVLDDHWKRLAWSLCSRHEKTGDKQRARFFYKLLDDEKSWALSFGTGSSQFENFLQTNEDDELTVMVRASRKFKQGQDFSEQEIEKLIAIADTGVGARRYPTDENFFIAWHLSKRMETPEEKAEAYYRFLLTSETSGLYVERIKFYEDADYQALRKRITCLDEEFKAEAKQRISQEHSDYADFVYNR
jgi:hypothetical protein